MYENIHTSNRLYNSKSFKNNKHYYSKSNSSLINYNKNINYIKRDRGIYSILKEKINIDNLENISNINNTQSINFQNLASNNTYRDYPLSKKKLKNLKINNIIDLKAILPPKRNNKSYKNISYSATSNKFWKTNINFYNNKINKINGINNIKNKKNNFDKNKKSKNKIEIIIDNLKIDFGYNKNNIKNKIKNNKMLLYKSNNNNNNFSSNLNKKIINFKYKINNYKKINNIKNYLNIITNICKNEIKNKNYNNYNVNKNNNKLFKKYFSNNNYIPLNTFSFFDLKKNNFLITRNNKNNYYILNTNNNNENYYKQSNNINNKKYSNSFTEIPRIIKQNNILFDYNDNNNNSSSNNIFLNLKNNFKNKRNNSYFNYKNKSNDIYCSYNSKENNLYNIFSKNQINNCVKQSYIDTKLNLSLMNFQNSIEESIDINNIDNSSILVNNENND